MRNMLANVLLLTMLVSPASAMEAGRGVELDEVVVTATRTELPAGESPQGVTLVTAEELEAAGQRLDQALDRQVGLQVSRTGSASMAELPVIRGSQPGQVLILLDGQRLNSQQSGWFSLSDLPLPAAWISRAEVVEGAASAVHGPEAMGGVVNILPLASGLIPASLTIDAGSHDRFGFELSLPIPPALLSLPGKPSMAVAVGRERENGFRANSDSTTDRIAISAGIPAAGPFSLEILAALQQRDAGSPGPVAFPSGQARQSDDTGIYQVRAGYALGDDARIDLAAHVNRYVREYRDPSAGFDSRHRTNSGGVTLSTTARAACAGRVTGGIEAQWDDLDSTDDGRRSLERQAAFLQDELAIPGNATLTGSIRLDSYSDFDDQFSPRLALVWHPAKSFSARLSASRGHRTPTFDDLYWSDPYAVGNPDLEPEQAWSYEAGLHAAAPSGIATADLSFFRRDVDDLIVWGDADGDWVWSPENVASARFLGASLAIRGTCPLTGTRVRLGYAYLDPEDRQTGELIAGKTRNEVEIALTYPGRVAEVSASATWIDRYAAANLEDPSYWTTSLRLSRAFALPGRYGVLETSVFVDNALDEEYEVTAGYPMPGREFGLRLGWYPDIW
jgi:outer membrane cobalamin receptor